MIVTIRELNGFGNVLQSMGRTPLAKHVHAEVRELLRQGISEFDAELDTTEANNFWQLIIRTDSLALFMEQKK